MRTPDGFRAEGCTQRGATCLPIDDTIITKKHAGVNTRILSHGVALKPTKDDIAFVVKIALLYEEKEQTAEKAVAERKKAKRREQRKL